MAFLSRFIHLQPILRAECRSIVRVFASGDCTSILLAFSSAKPWSLLNSLTFQKDLRTKNYQASCNLFSTDSKTPKGEQESDSTILKKLESSSKKRTRRYYTEEEDELIMERVKQMGSDNPETWKSLANELNVKWAGDVRRRHNLLVKKGSGKLQVRRYTAEEDAIILKIVKEMGCGNKETWETIAKELDRDIISSSYLDRIKSRYELIISRDTMETKRFTEKDDKMIMRFVSKHGEETATWEKLAFKLNMKYAFSVQKRYELLVMKDSIVTGAFTEDEDRIIVSDVETYGDHLKTFKNLCEKLNRNDPRYIRRRLEWLQNKPAKPPGPWSFSEDQILIEHIFQVHR